MKEKTKEKAESMFDAVHRTADEILNEIIAPVCSVIGISANIYMAKISDYDRGNEQNRRVILGKMVKKYEIDMNMLEKIQDHPLALLALYVLDKDGR